jgi:hypothetical protein
MHFLRPNLARPPKAGLQARKPPRFAESAAKKVDSTRVLPLNVRDWPPKDFPKKVLAEIIQDETNKYRDRLSPQEC